MEDSKPDIFTVRLTNGGHKAVDDVVNHYDIHATLLHQFGIDAADLTYKRNGREQTLLDGQPGTVIDKLLA